MKCKKARRQSKEALQIADERREAKSKGERERHTELNGEFQRIAKRVRRPFSMNNANKQRKIIEMWKTRDPFKKTGDIKRTFHARMGII